MDYSKLSDATLKQIASGKELDYSTLSDDDLKHIASQPQEPAKEMPIGYAETAARGIGQGLGMGFGDELEASIKSPVGAIKKIGSRVGLADENSPDIQEYMGNLSEARNLNEQAAKQNPLTYYGSEIGSGLVGVAAKGLPGLVVQGALTGYGASQSDSLPQQLVGTALGGALGGTVAASNPIVGAILKRLGSGASGVAENLANKAVGFTGRELQKAPEGVGRFALDKGLVKFGSHPEDIALAAEKLQQQSGQGIGQALSQADQAGARISNEDLSMALLRKAQQYSGNEAEAGIGKRLTDMSNDLHLSPSFERPLSDVEQVKRSLQDKANFDKLGVLGDQTQANRQASDIYRQMVEDRASSVSPEIGQAFQQNKQNYRMATPIQEAAERRSSQLQQNPIFGLNDIAASGLGGLIGGLPGAAASAIGRRVVGPRISSSGAYVADQASKALTQIGQKLETQGIKNADAIGQSAFGPMLLNAASKGPQSLAVTQFLLQQTDPKYRELSNGKHIK